MKAKLIYALACSMMLAACGSMENPNGKTIADDDDFTTGSNIPQHGPKQVKTIDTESIHDMRGISATRMGSGN